MRTVIRLKKSIMALAFILAVNGFSLMALAGPAPEDERPGTSVENTDTKSRKAEPVIDTASTEGKAGTGGIISYIVEKGDNLIKLSKRFYGNAIGYLRIFEANNEDIKDPDKIYIGQEFVIPEEGAGGVEATAGVRSAVTGAAGSSEGAGGAAGSSDADANDADANDGGSGSAQGSGIGDPAGNSRITGSDKTAGASKSSESNKSTAIASTIDLRVVNNTESEFTGIMIGPARGTTRSDVNAASTPLKPGKAMDISVKRSGEYGDDDRYSIYLYDSQGGNSKAYSYFSTSGTTEITITPDSREGYYKFECR